jgi:O-antigen/teichoic acid export membrane protein
LIFFRRLFKDFATYGTADIVVRSTAFITLPIYTRLFPPEEYGIWAALMAVVGLLNAFLALGGDSAYARHFFEARTHEARRRITSTLLWFLLGWALVITLALLPLAPVFARWYLEQEGRGLVVVLAVIGTPLTLANAMASQVLRNQFRAKLYGALSVTTAVLSVALGLAAVLLAGMGIAGLFAGVVGAGVLMLPIRLWLIRDLLAIEFSRSVLRDLLSFGLPLVPMSVAYWVFASSDRIMLGKLASLEQVGLYSVAAAATSVLALVNSALGQAWSPHAVQAYEADSQKAAVLFGQVLTYIVAGLGLMAVGVAAFARDLLVVLTTPAFYAAAPAVAPLALGYLAYASTQVTAAGISLKKRTGYFALYAWIAAVLNIGLNFLLIPRWGMLGSAWATAASYGFLTVVYAVTSQRLWAIRYEWGRAVILVTLTLVFALGAMFLPALPLIQSIPLKAAYVLTFLALVFLFRALDQREIDAVRTLLRRAPGQAA